MNTHITAAEESFEVAVEIIDGKATTTSLDVARHFRKLHKDVLKRISSLDCSEDFHRRNFAPMTIKITVGKGAQRNEPAYRMTRDGFTFLCMGFTGKEAAQWKETYINAFNRMEQALIEQPELLSYRHLLQFSLKTLELMRDRTSRQLPRLSTEQVVQNYLNVESLDTLSPEQMVQAITFLQGQMVGEGAAAKSLPGVAGTTVAKDLLYGLLRSAHDAELMFNTMYDSGIEKLASEAFKNHMATKLEETSRQARELLGYVTSRAVRTPFTTH